MIDEEKSTQTSRFESEEWSIKELWEKYEEIAMHFNDLLIRLRTSALGGVAALSTLLGIFGKSGTEPRTSWEIAAGLFLFRVTCFPNEKKSTTNLGRRRLNALNDSSSP